MPRDKILGWGERIAGEGEGGWGFRKSSNLLANAFGRSIAAEYPFICSGAAERDCLLELGAGRFVLRQSRGKIICARTCRKM